MAISKEALECLMAGVGSFDAQLDAATEIRRLTEQLDDMRIQANCGGVRTDKHCSSDGHFIFGPYHGLGDGIFMCEFHSMQQAITKLTEQLRVAREWINSVCRLAIEEYGSYHEKKCILCETCWPQPEMVFGKREHKPDCPMLHIPSATIEKESK